MEYKMKRIYITIPEELYYKVHKAGLFNKIDSILATALSNYLEMVQK
ncbi:Uncharacterised protein [uncultured archaeon]|nr:Uncharacterised protein [uncultured archaeon]